MHSYLVLVQIVDHFLQFVVDGELVACWIVARTVPVLVEIVRERGKNLMSISANFEARLDHVQCGGLGQLGKLIPRCDGMGMAIT